MFKEVRKTFLDQIHTRSEWGQLRAETHTPSKFGGKPLSGLCEILPTNQPTNKRTKM